MKLTVFKVQKFKEQFFMMIRVIKSLMTMAMKLIKVLLSFPELTKKMWKHFVKGILVPCKVKPLAAIVRTISIRLKKTVK